MTNLNVLNQTDLIAVGIELGKNATSEVASLFYNKLEMKTLIQDTWVNGCIAIYKGTNIEVSNPNAKVIISQEGELSIHSFNRLHMQDGIMTVLEVVQSLRVVKVSAKEYFTSGIPVTNPEVEHKRLPLTSVLPARAGKGRRKAYLDVTRILSKHLLNTTDIDALKFPNVEIYQIVNKMGGTYTDPLTDVIVRCGEDRVVIVESDTWSLTLPARRTGGANVPYTLFASVDARDVTDLQEIANVLHTLTTIVSLK